VRLLGAQADNGGWPYISPQVPDSEVKRLEAHYRDSKGKTLPPVKRPRGVRDLAPEVQELLKSAGPRPALQVGDTDNSNTQFATLALWVGRRQGVPVDVALGLVDRRFRGSQNVADGGWGYTLPGGGDSDPRPSMT